MDTSNIKKIKQLLEQAQTILDSYDNADRDRMLELHHSEFSLPGCLRWGIQASEDILEAEG